MSTNESNNPHNNLDAADQRNSMNRYGELQLDPNFGTHGIAFCSGPEKEYSQAANVYREDDGALLALVYTPKEISDNQKAIVRLDANGNIETSFGTDGYMPIVLSPGGHIPSQLNKITTPGQPEKHAFVITCLKITQFLGRYRWTLAKLLLNGSPDISFGVNGEVDVSAMFDFNYLFNDEFRAYIGADQKIYLFLREHRDLREYHSYIARLTDDGKLDSTFHDKGYYEILGDRGVFACPPKLGKDGKFYTYGFINNGLGLLICFTANMELDTDFSPGPNPGTLPITDGPDIAYPDTSPSESGIFITGAHFETSSIVHTKLCKYTREGKKDPKFNGGQPVITPIGEITYSLLDWSSQLPDGRVLCKGRSVISPSELGPDLLLYFTPEGELDTRYQEGSGIGFTYKDLSLQHDSAIIANEQQLIQCGTNINGETFEAVIFGFKL